MWARTLHFPTFRSLRNLEVVVTFQEEYLNNWSSYFTVMVLAFPKCKTPSNDGWTTVI